jgi:hypothetical protein
MVKSSGSSSLGGFKIFMRAVGSATTGAMGLKGSERESGSTLPGLASPARLHLSIVRMPERRRQMNKKFCGEKREHEGRNHMDVYMWCAGSHVCSFPYHQRMLSSGLDNATQLEQIIMTSKFKIVLLDESSAFFWPGVPSGCARHLTKTRCRGRRGNRSLQTARFSCCMD